MAIELGTAFVNIVPSAKGITANIARELLPVADEAEGAGKKAGGLFANAFAGNLKNLKKFLPAAAFAGFGALALHAAEQVENANSIIIRTTGASGKAAKALEESFKNVGKRVGTPLEQVATVVAQLAQRTGLAGEPLEKLSTELLRFQKQAVGGAGVGVQELTRVMAGFNVPAEQMAGQLDRLFKAGQATGVPISQLIGILSVAGSTFRQFGFDLGQSTVILGSLDKAGVPARLAIVALRNAFNQFAREGKEPRKALTDTIAEIQRLAKVGDEAAARKLGVQVFGSRGSGLVDAAIQGKLNLDQLTKSLSLNGDGIDATARRTSSFSDKMKVLHNNVQLAMAELGSPVLDLANQTLGRMLPVLTKITDLFTSLPKPVQEAALAITGLAVGIGPVQGVFDHLVQGVSTLAQGTLAVGTIFSKTGKAIENFGRGFANATAAASETTGVFGTLGGKISTLFDGLRGGTKAAIDSFKGIETAVTRSKEVVTEFTTVEDAMRIAQEGGAAATGAATLSQEAYQAALASGVAVQELNAVAAGESATALGAEAVATDAAAASTAGLTFAILGLEITIAPVLLIVAAIVALAAAFVLAYLKIKPFHDAVNALAGAIVHGLGVAIDFVRRNWIDIVGLILLPFGPGIVILVAHHFSQIVRVISGVLTTAIGVIRRFVTAIPGALAGLGGIIVRAFVSFVTGIPAALASLGPVLVSVFQTAFAVLKQTLEVLIAGAIISIALIPFLIVTKLIPAAVRFAEVGLSWMRSLGLAILRAIPGILAFFATLPFRIAATLVGLQVALARAALRAMEAFAEAEERGFVRIGRFFAALPGRIIAAAGNAATWFISIGEAAMRGLVTGLTRGFGAVVNFFRALPGRMRAGGGNAATWIVDLGTRAITGLISGLTRALPHVFDFFRRLPGQVIRAVGDIGRAVEHIGEEIVHGIERGIINAGTGIFNQMKDVIKGAIDKVKSFFGIFSPARATIPLGKSLVDGQVKGVKDQEPKLVNQMVASTKAGITAANNEAKRNPPVIPPPKIPKLPKVDFKPNEQVNIGGTSGGKNFISGAELQRLSDAVILETKNGIEKHAPVAVKPPITLDFSQLRQQTADGLALNFNASLATLGGKKPIPINANEVFQFLSVNASNNKAIDIVTQMRQEIPRLSAAFGDLSTASKGSATFTQAQTTAMKILHDEIGVRGKRALDIYTTELLRETAASQASAQSARSLHTASLDVGDAFQQLADGLKNTHGTLNEATQDGRDNARNFQSAADSVLAFSQAQIAAKVPIKQVADTLLVQEQSLFNTARQYFATDQQAAQYVATALGIPPNIVSTITSNAATAMLLVQGYSDSVNHAPKSHSTEIDPTLIVDGKPVRFDAAGSAIFGPLTPKAPIAPKLQPKLSGIFVNGVNVPLNAAGSAVWNDAAQHPKLQPKLSGIIVNGVNVPLNAAGSAIFPPAAAHPKVTPQLSGIIVNGVNVPLNKAGSAIFPPDAAKPKITPEANFIVVAGRKIPMGPAAIQAIANAVVPPGSKGPNVPLQVNTANTAGGSVHPLPATGAVIAGVIQKGLNAAPPRIRPDVVDAIVAGVATSLTAAGAQIASTVQRGVDAHPVIITPKINQVDKKGGSLHDVPDVGRALTRVISRGVAANPVLIVPRISEADIEGGSIHPLPIAGATITKVLQKSTKPVTVAVAAKPTPPSGADIAKFIAATKRLTPTLPVQVDHKFITKEAARAADEFRKIKPKTPVSIPVPKILRDARQAVRDIEAIMRSHKPIEVQAKLVIAKFGPNDTLTFTQAMRQGVAAVDAALIHVRTATQRVIDDQNKLRAINRTIVADEANVADKRKANAAAQKKLHDAEVKLFIDTANHASKAQLDADKLNLGLARGNAKKATEDLNKAEKKLADDRKAAGSQADKIKQDTDALTQARQAQHDATESLRAMVDEHASLVAQLGSTFDKWLESLKLPPQYFDDIAQSAQSMAQQVQSNLSNLTNVATGGFRDLVSGRTLEHVTEWASAIRQMEEMGLAPQLIAQFIQAGPSSWREAQKLVAGGQPLVDQLNAVTGEIFRIGTNTFQNAIAFNPAIALPPWAQNPNEWAAAGIPPGGMTPQQQRQLLRNGNVYNFNVTGMMDAKTAALFQEWQDWIAITGSPQNG